MSFGDCKDIGLWQATRRKFLKIFAVTGAVSAVDLLDPFKKMGFGKERGMTLEEMREKAAWLLMKPNPFMCAQATLAVGQEKLGRKDWEVVRAMEAFGGGLSTGEVCGALVGALAVMGLRFGRSGEDEKFSPTIFRYTIEVIKRFRETIVQSHGGIHCREITGIDWMNREQVLSFYKPDEKGLECMRIVGDTAKLIGELLERGT